jgi:CubicO group peptidase (beta-lactamase class C family)
MAIDAARSEGWRAYIEQNLFAPAGMTQTYHRVTGIERRRIAMPHDVADNLRFFTTPFRRSDATMNAADGHLSTLGDLARWLTLNMSDGAIDGRQVLAPEFFGAAHELMMRHTLESNFAFGPFKRDGWAMGWDVGSYEGDAMLSRIGTFESYRSHLSYLPRRRVGVVAETNAQTGFGLTDAIAAYVYDLAAGRPNAEARALARLDSTIANKERVPIRRANGVRLDAARDRPLSHPLAAYAGAYASPAYGEIRWTERDGKLWFEFGPYSGPAAVNDAPRNQVRFRIGFVPMRATFTFGGGEHATEVNVNNEMFFRRRD